MVKEIKFREIRTPEGKVILAGRDALSNEKLINQAKLEEFLFHTASPGSPFVNIKGDATKEDIKLASIFCAVYSREWKTNRKDVEIHQFKKKDMFKDKWMETGTFGVRSYKSINLKKKEIEKWLEQK